MIFVIRPRHGPSGREVFQSNRLNHVDLPVNHEVVWDNTLWESQTRRLYHLQPRITTCTSAMSHGSLKEMEENPQQQRNGKAKGRGMLSRRFSGFSGGIKNNTHISLRQVFEQKFLWLFALLLFFSWPHLLLELKFPKKNTAAGGQRSRRVNFRSVVVDECAQATEPEVVLCVMRLLDWIFWKGPRYFWWKKSC